MEHITERYKSQIAGVLNCYDRAVFTGTLLNRCYSEGMEKFLRIHKIRCYDYPQQFALSLAERIKVHAGTVAAQAGLEIEYLGRSKIRKESFVLEKIQKRGIIKC